SVGSGTGRVSRVTAGASGGGGAGGAEGASWPQAASAREATTARRAERRTAGRGAGAWVLLVFTEIPFRSDAWKRRGAASRRRYAGAEGKEEERELMLRSSKHC